MTSPRLIVLGGGAAGFFAASAAAEANPRARVTILERGAGGLAKVLISGGGRCNVTNAEEDPGALAAHYPRGGRELRGPFHRFGPRETKAWFAARGVALKTEPDGRVFPESDRSETVAEALRRAARERGVLLRTRAVVEIVEPEGEGFRLRLAGGEALTADRLLLATGSAPAGWAWARALGHRVVDPVPSLFTFNVRDPRLEGLAGLSVPRARLRAPDQELEQTGPLLITHWGLSGPAALRLSAWGARAFHAADYRFPLRVRWTDGSPDGLQRAFESKRREAPRRTVAADGAAPLPERLWGRLVAAAGLPAERRWAEVTAAEREALIAQLTDGVFAVTGKSAFKDEFVSAGGVALTEVDFRTMESRRRPGLYFAGEILDVDGVTGGFNFQNAWTTGRIAGESMARAAKENP